MKIEKWLIVPFVSNGNPIPLERNTFKRLDFYQFKKYSICLKLIFILLSI